MSGIHKAIVILTAILATNTWAAKLPQVNRLARAGGMRIVSIRRMPRAKPTYQMVDQQSLVSRLVPPFIGFSPLIAVVASDEHSNMDFDFEHRLVSGYKGRPLRSPTERNYVIGLLDTGAQVHLIFQAGAEALGIVGPYLSPNTFPVGGTGGLMYTQITRPIGIFAAGLSAINDSGTLDLSKVVGHTNVCALIGPALGCNEEYVRALVGLPMLAFYKSIIRQDLPRRVTMADKVYISPDVELTDRISPKPSEYQYKIPIQITGLGPVTTASYYGWPDLDDLFGPIEPLTPTMLSMFSLSFPTGGALFTQIGVLEGGPGPLNPMQLISVMVDTGAQASIISPNVAAKLSLPLEPDFVVNVCGIGGLTEAPGYFVDYVRINALGGALEFSNVPFIVLDVGSAEGGALDGILGTNVFWNRNIIIEPSLTGSGFIHVSRPVSYAFIDLDGDGLVTLKDFAVLAMLWGANSDDPSWNPACDLFADDLIDYKDLAAFCDSWRTSRQP